MDKFVVTKTHQQWEQILHLLAVHTFNRMLGTFFIYLFFFFRNAEREKNHEGSVIFFLI